MHLLVMWLFEQSDPPIFRVGWNFFIGLSPGTYEDVIPQAWGCSWRKKEKKTVKLGLFPVLVWQTRVRPLLMVWMINWRVLKILFTFFQFQLTLLQMEMELLWSHHPSWEEKFKVTFLRLKDGFLTRLFYFNVKVINFFCATWEDSTFLYSTYLFDLLGGFLCPEGLKRLPSNRQQLSHVQGI